MSDLDDLARAKGEEYSLSYRGAARRVNSMQPLPAIRVVSRPQVRPRSAFGAGFFGALGAAAAAMLILGFCVIGSVFFIGRSSDQYQRRKAELLQQHSTSRSSTEAAPYPVLTHTPDGEAAPDNDASTSRTPSSPTSVRAAVSGSLTLRKMPDGVNYELSGMNISKRSVKDVWIGIYADDKLNPLCVVKFASIGARQRFSETFDPTQYPQWPSQLPLQAKYMTGKLE